MKKVSIKELINWLNKIKQSYNTLINDNSKFIIKSIYYKRILIPVYVHSDIYELGWTSIYNIESDIVSIEKLTFNELIEYCKKILEIL